MKQFISFALLACLVAISCNKNNNAIEVPEGNNPKTGWHTVTISAKAPEAETKTAYDSDKTFSWTAGDKISVLMNNGTEEQFFTFSVVSPGNASSDFIGEVLDGYDTFGSVSDGTKWALYPASNEHEFHDDWTETDAYKILFHIPSVIDLSENFSANIPMKAIGDDSNNYVFSPITAAFKFTFKLADGISKVRLKVSRSSSYYLSGKMPFRSTDGEFLAFEQRQSRGSLIGEITITRSVETVGSDKVATFYIPYRIYQALTPTIQLYNADNDYTIYTGTAKSAITASDQKRITVLPTADLTAKGLGSPYILGTGIDWAKVDMYPDDSSKEAFPSNNASQVVEWKASSDANNIYLFYKIPVTESRVYSNGYVVASFDTDNDSSTGGEANYSLGGGMEYYNYSFPFPDKTNPVTFYSGIYGSNKMYAWGGSSWTSGGTAAATYGKVLGDYVYVETSLPRTSIGSPASGTQIKVNVGLNSYPAGAQTITMN